MTTKNATEHVIESADRTSRTAQAAAYFSAFLAGDRLQLGRLVELLSPLLWHIARGQGVHHDVVQDLVQGAWLKLIDKADTIETPEAVTSWLVTTVRRDAWRHLKADRQYDSMDPELTEIRMAEPAHNPENVVVRKDTLSLVWKHVQALTPLCQTLIRGLASGAAPDYAEICRGFDIPVGSIGPTRARCLKKLREALKAADITLGGEHSAS